MCTDARRGPRSLPLLLGFLLTALAGNAAGPLAFRSVSCPAPRHGQDLAAADMNLDGAPDLVLVARGRAVLLPGLGDGTFGKAQTIPGARFLSSPAIEDYNRDGWPDIAVLGLRGVYVLRGTPEGRPVRGSRTPLRYPLLGIASGDVDGDGLPDLLVGRLKLWGGTFHLDHQACFVVVFRGLGDGTFADLGQYDARKYPGAIAAADFDRDGILDMAVADSSGEGAIEVRRGLGAGLFGEAVTYAAPRSLSLIAADFNGDGWLDLALASGGEESAAVLHGGPAGFGAPLVYPVPEARGYAAAGDLDGDGLPDLALTAGKRDGAVLVMRGLPGGGLGPAVAFPVAEDPRGVAVADLDADGRLDVAAASYAEKALVVLLNASAPNP